MKRSWIIPLLVLGALSVSCVQNKVKVPGPPLETTLSKDVLLDKIKGGWAGQTIGCTYGGPTEFRYSTFINEIGRASCRERV